MNECRLTCFDGGISELRQAQDAPFKWLRRQNLRSRKKTTTTTFKQIGISSPIRESSVDGFCWRMENDTFLNGTARETHQYKNIPLGRISKTTASVSCVPTHHLSQLTYPFPDNQLTRVMDISDSDSSMLQILKCRPNIYFLSPGELSAFVC